jgi:hypothetical protein
MDGLKPPERITFEGNVKKQWKTFSQELSLYLTATDKDKKSSATRAPILVILLRGREVYNTFKFDDGENSLDYDLIVKKFEEFCIPKTNETCLRYKFFTMRQNEGQSFDNFLTEIKAAATECNFSTLEDSLVRDMIVIGTSNQKLKERLLRDTNLTLDMAAKPAKAAEATMVHTEEMKAGTSRIVASPSVDQIQHKAPYSNTRGASSSYRATVLKNYSAQKL